MKNYSTKINANERLYEELNYGVEIANEGELIPLEEYVLLKINYYRKTILISPLLDANDNFICIQGWLLGKSFLKVTTLDIFFLGLNYNFSYLVW